MQTVEDIRTEFRVKLINKIYVEDGNIEILNANFIANEPTIFGKLDQDYIDREMTWYHKQSKNIFHMDRPIPKIWQKIANTYGDINSNYGALIFSEQHGSQYQQCLEQLTYNIHTRRAVMIYMPQTMHIDAEVKGMNDFVCTYAVQFLVRDKLLYCIINMRSSDAIFGYKNDRHWHTEIHKQLLFDLRLKDIYHHIRLGPIIWNAGSLHIYPSQFNLIK